MQRALNENFLMSTDYISYAIEGNTSPRQRRSRSPFHAPKIAVVDGMQRFEQEDSSLLARDRLKGMILYYRNKADGETNFDRIVEIDGERITWPSIHKPRGFYSNESKSIYAIGLANLSFRQTEPGS